MYHYESRVRFSETDKERKLTLEAIVDYFQDCSTFQTEDLGVGFSYLLPKNLTWVLSYWHIVVDEYPALGEKIEICTIPYEFKGILGKRNFFMEKGGKRIVKADSLWTLLDMEKMLPVMATASGPLTRTTAMAPPGGVARAQMVSCFILLNLILKI